ncbi:MAG: hypothetical protein ACKVZJ_02865 [Phycisphaerales bacterium]
MAYVPAPGQLINAAQFGDPSRAVGAPIGGGTVAPDNTKLVTLGGFGGSITLRFVPPIEDDPANPYGIDAIIFGNALYASANPNRRFAEAGVIEISRDDNANGVADDAWFVIPGSHLPAPPVSAAQTQPWDSLAGTPTPPTNLAWYPAPPNFIGWPMSYATTGLRLPGLFEAQVVVNPNGLSATLEGARGYADFTPTLLLGDTDADNLVDLPGMDAGLFYTEPDNPFVVGVSPGSGGGDGFDVRWAVDAATGAAALRDRFDFVRISTGVNFIAGPLGELSTEVGGVARVRARPEFFDVTSDGAADAEDLYRWHAAGGTLADFTGEGVVDDADSALLQRCVRRGEAADVGVGR